MKIIIIGAGEGGLIAAERLALSGHEVRVLEICGRESLGYDWRDDVSSGVFEELNLDLPKETVIKTQDLSFEAPFYGEPITVLKKAGSLTYSIERRRLLGILLNRAESAGAALCFEKRVDSLLFDGALVRGVSAGGNQLCADLTIDSSGCLSLFRASLPRSLGIPAMPHSGELFYAYRAYYERNGSGLSTPQSRRYLKYPAPSGVSWCLYDQVSNSFDVLIGKTGGLNSREISQALRRLRSSVPELGEKIVRGGAAAVIPARYPASKFVTNGYALVGDSAFMTVPLFGSGIASAMRAGAMLAETVNQNADVSCAGLWDYQVKFMTSLGAKHVAIDMAKRRLLKAKDEDLKSFLSSGILNRDRLSRAVRGDFQAPKKAELLNYLLRPDTLKPLLKLLSFSKKCKNAYEHAKNPPGVYSTKAVSLWQAGLDGFFS